MNYLAQNATTIGTPLQGIGPLGLEGKPATDAPLVFTSFISGAVGIMTIIAIIWFVFLIVGGAISYMGAGGDKQAIESAKKKVVSGVIGLVAVIASLFIVNLIGYLIGIPDILNLESLLSLIKIS